MKRIRIYQLVLFFPAALIILWLSCFFYSQAAVNHWASLGGGVDDLYTLTGGPQQMSLGSAPGQEVSNSDEKILRAAVRLNGIPWCRELVISGDGCSNRLAEQLVRSLKLERLHLMEFDIDEALGEAICDSSSIQDLALGAAGDARLIREFLDRSPVRTVRISGITMPEEERASIKQRFGKRFD